MTTASHLHGILGYQTETTEEFQKLLTDREKKLPKVTQLRHCPWRPRRHPWILMPETSKDCRKLPNVTQLMMLPLHTGQRPWIVGILQSRETMGLRLVPLQLRNSVCCGYKVQFESCKLCHICCTYRWSWELVRDC